MLKAKKTVARERLRRNLDETSTTGPTRAELYLATYAQLDRAQLCAEPVERLKEARDLIDQLIASYKAVH